MDTVDHIVSRFNLYKGKYCLFAGAGISVCAGIPLASRDLPGLPSIVSHIRADYYKSIQKHSLSDAELLSWYVDQKLLQRPETLYSDAMDLIGDAPRARQHYLRRFFDGKEPGSCHRSIAGLVELGFLNVILTTNFDPLVEDAIQGNGKCGRPKVAAHADTVKDVLLGEAGPKVIKLHGDYLFSNMKNTSSETKTLTNNMREKLQECLKENGLLTIGYSGNDTSIISIFEEMAYDGGFFPFGLYWLHINSHPPSDRVRTIIRRLGGLLLPIVSAEEFLEAIYSRLEEPT